MTVHINIPPSIEDAIRAAGGDVTSAVREAAFVEFYRRGLISHGKLAQELGIARTQVDSLLKRYNVTEDLMTVEELEKQLDTIRRIAG